MIYYLVLLLTLSHIGIALRASTKSLGSGNLERRDNP